MPLKFGRVNGDFNCGYNKLSSLKGSPSYVGGYFSCYGNNLTSLEGAPIHVVGDFDCVHNKLESLCISSNKIQYIPDNLYESNNLTELDISSNDITNISIKLTNLINSPFLYCKYYEECVKPNDSKKK